MVFASSISISVPFFFKICITRSGVKSFVFSFSILNSFCLLTVRINPHRQTYRVDGRSIRICLLTGLLGLDWLIALQQPKHIYGIRLATDRKRAYGYDWEQEIEDVVPQIWLFHSKLQSPVAVPTDIKFFLNHFPNAILTTSTIGFT